MKETVIKPWTPIAVSEKDGEIVAEVWGRRYTIGKKSFLQSVVSQGKELLAAPIRLVGTEDGEECVWEEHTTLMSADADEAHVDIMSASQSKRFIVNVSLHIEYDGCIEANLSVMPRGKTVAESFGFGQAAPYEYRLSRFWLEIPLKNECAEYFQFFPCKENFENTFESAGIIKGNLSLPFKEQLFVSDDETGFMIFFESFEA